MAIRDLIAWKKNQDSLLGPQDFERDPVRLLQWEMNRLFNDFFAPWAEDGNWFSGRSASFMPDIDIRETDKEYRVTIELPGVDEKDIDLSLSGNTLIVKGEKKEEHQHQDRHYYQAQPSFEPFHRQL